MPTRPYLPIPGCGSRCAILLAAAAAVAFSTPVKSLAASPSVELIDRDIFFGNPTRAQLRVSPDGKWLSWLAPRDGVLNVWIAPVGNVDAARAITAEKVRPIRQHFWAANSKLVLYLNDKDGDENFLLYVLYPDEGHGFARPQNHISFYAVAEAFLAEQLGGRFQPVGDDFRNSSITVPEGAKHVPGLAESLGQSGG